MLCKDTDAQEESHVMTGAETGVMQHKPRNTKDWQPPPEARAGKQGFSPAGFRGPWLPPPSGTFSFRTAGQYIFVTLGHTICGTFLWQPSETKIFLDTKSFWKARSVFYSFVAFPVSSQ